MEMGRQGSVTSEASADPDRTNGDPVGLVPQRFGKNMNSKNVNALP